MQETWIWRADLNYTRIFALMEGWCPEPLPCSKAHCIQEFFTHSTVAFMCCKHLLPNLQLVFEFSLWCLLMKINLNFSVVTFKNTFLQVGGFVFYSILALDSLLPKFLSKSFKVCFEHLSSQSIQGGYLHMMGVSWDPFHSPPHWDSLFFLFFIF